MNKNPNNSNYQTTNMRIHPLYRLCKLILMAEPLVLLVILVAYWFPSPQRDQVIWIIALLIPIMIARFVIYHRLWTNTPFDELCLTFIALCIINNYVAPYTPRSIVIFRPLFGMALLLYCVEYARTRGTIDRLIGAAVIAAMFTGIISLTAVNWAGKSSLANDFTQYLPQLQNLPPLWTGGFNANELAGVLAFLFPFAAGIAIRPGFHPDKQHLLRRLTAGAAALMMLAGLIFGQSLSAIVGCIFGLMIVFAPRGLWRAAALGGVIFFALSQIAIMTQPTGTINLLKALSPRQGDNSLNHREVIWISANAMLADHPFTGTGMSNFRFLRGDYPTPGYEDVLTPHAHNEILQIGADLGLSGIAVFVGWYVMSGYLVLFIWRRGNDDVRVVAVSLAGAFVSHAIFGLADAIPLWDRFYFIFWMLLGLTAAAAVVARTHAPPSQIQLTEAKTEDSIEESETHNTVIDSVSSR